MIDRYKATTRVLFFFFFFFISLIADGPHHYHPACGHKGSSHLSPVLALQFFLSRCKFSTLTTRQPMVEFYLLTFPRFPLRKKEHKSYFGKNRTHDFRTSRCAAYLLDHSGDERLLQISVKTKERRYMMTGVTCYQLERASGSTIIFMVITADYRSTPVAQLAPRNLLTRWDVSSIPANGIFLTKNKKNKKKMPNGWRTINSLVHKIRLRGRRGKGMAESFSRQKSRHAPQKEGGLKILCDLPPV